MYDSYWYVRVAPVCCIGHWYKYVLSYLCTSI